MENAAKHISTYIDSLPDEVYQFVRTPTNLPLWAGGLSSTITYINGQWQADSPMGKVTIAFAPDNPFGVLDHAVTLPSGEVINNPMRVFPHGRGCEVVFSLLKRPETTEEEFAQDAQMVKKDLAALKALLEH